MNNCIVVLGTHRSGTSALMGALSLCGVYIGPKWLQDLYEHSEIVTLHDEMMTWPLKSSWDDTFALTERWWLRAEISAYSERIKKIIKRDFSCAVWWGIKDPRMCVLIPFWLEIFVELEISPHFILSIRNPLEIAKSHKRRDRFSLEKSLLIWLKHLLSAEYFTRGYPRVFSSYDKLIENPRETIKNIFTAFNVGGLRSFAKVGDSLDAFIKPVLKHHNFDNNLISLNLPDWIVDLHQLLIKFAETSDTSEDSLAKLDKIRDKFLQMQNLLLNGDLKSTFIDAKDLMRKRYIAASNLSQIASDFMLAGEFKKAKVIFENLIQFIPENHVFWNNLGIAEENSGEIQKAFSCFKKALSIRPTYAIASQNIERIVKKYRHHSKLLSPQ